MNRAISFKVNSTDDSKVYIANSIDDFIYKICKIITKQAREKISSMGSFTFVLSGGRTPVLIFRELAKNYQSLIEWGKVHFFWVDERCVDSNDIDSNYNLANINLISKISTVGSIHRIRGELAPRLGAKIYSEELIAFFDKSEIKFDLVLLGMGEDGHVGSIFPNSKEIELRNEVVLPTEKKYKGHYRITLGLDILNKSDFNLLLVNNKQKLRVLESKDDTFPVNRIKNKEIIILK